MEPPKGPLEEAIEEGVRRWRRATRVDVGLPGHVAAVLRERGLVTEQTVLEHLLDEAKDAARDALQRVFNRVLP